MARHRARPPLAEVLRDALRRRTSPAEQAAEHVHTVRPTLLHTASEAHTERLEPVLVDGGEATLNYPDGQQLPVGYTHDTTGSRRRVIALVPASARLVNGMVIRVDDAVVAVAVRDTT